MAPQGMKYSSLLQFGIMVLDLAVFQAQNSRLMREGKERWIIVQQDRSWKVAASSIKSRRRQINRWIYEADHNAWKLITWQSVVFQPASFCASAASSNIWYAKYANSVGEKAVLAFLIRRGKRNDVTEKETFWRRYATVKTKKNRWHLPRLLASSYNKRVGLTHIQEWSSQNYNSEVNSMRTCMLGDLVVTSSWFCKVLSLRSTTLEHAKFIPVLGIVIVQKNL
jgi:hypothetical protein